ncbi:MAG: hypothetical protein ACLTOM_13415 [Roseburia sp.]
MEKIWYFAELRASGCIGMNMAISMLGHPKKMKEIIEYSYERALKEDTWANRAERLREFL